MCVRGHKGKTDHASVPNVEQQLVWLGWGLDLGDGGREGGGDEKGVGVGVGGAEVTLGLLCAHG